MYKEILDVYINRKDIIDKIYKNIKSNNSFIELKLIGYYNFYNINKIIKILNNNLKKLKISYCNFDINILCDYLKSNSSLIELELEYNKIDNIDNIDNLYEYLKYNNSLTELNLKCIKTKIDELCESLIYNSSLTNLNLMDNKIININNFCNNLKLNKSLCYLYLYNNFNSFQNELEELLNDNITLINVFY